MASHLPFHTKFFKFLKPSVETGIETEEQVSFNFYSYNPGIK